MFRELLTVALIILVLIIISLIFTYKKLGEKRIPQEEYGYNISQGEIRLAVLVDNEACNGLKSAWGLSVYLETGGHTILFDTGPSPGVLLSNAEKLGVDLSKVEAVVISHEHGDHTGGIGALRPYASRIKVYIPAGSSPGLRQWLERSGFRVVAVNRTMEIFPGVYVVAPLYGPPWEEALVVKAGDKGLVILVGCSHPGVDNIVERAVKDLGVKPYIVLGGFHLAGAGLGEISSRMEKLISLGVYKIYPIHCSGEGVKRYLAQKHPETLEEGCAGLILRIGGTSGG